MPGLTFEHMMVKFEGLGAQRVRTSDGEGASKVYAPVLVLMGYGRFGPKSAILTVFRYLSHVRPERGSAAPLNFHHFYPST